MSRRTQLLAVLGAATLVAAVLVAAPAAVLAAGNADAAHACQQGGYAVLHGTDGTTFKNAGDCVAFVAQGGTITNVSQHCSFTAGTSGCVELDSVQASNTSGTTTLSGMFTFAPITTWDFFHPGTAAGSGTWTSSTGSSGTWTALNTTTTQLYWMQFLDGANQPTTCTAAIVRYVGIELALSGGGLASDSVMELYIRTGIVGNNGVIYQAFSATPPPGGEPLGLHTGTDVTGVTFRC
jgi:hypothetical protein